MGEDDLLQPEIFAHLSHIRKPEMKVRHSASKSFLLPMSIAQVSSVPRVRDSGHVCTSIWRRDRIREGTSAVKHLVAVMGWFNPQVVHRYIIGDIVKPG
jgi:hypothetical protein